MTETSTITERIERAAETVGSAWPIHSFVTANPLSGFEDRPFHRAVADAESVFGGRGYPKPAVFRRAWEEGRIDSDVLAAELDALGVERDPEDTLEEMAAATNEESDEVDEPSSAMEPVDRLTAKWLAAFLDEGRAGWPMPNREEGFYAAWRTLAPYDDEVPGVRQPSDLPENATEALERALHDHPEPQWEAIFEHHLAALPGWTGFVKRRATDGHGPWKEAAPISLADLLAVRLTLSDQLGVPVAPAEVTAEREADDDSDDLTDENDENDDVPLAEAWLSAWEKSYRSRLLDDVSENPAAADGGESRPAAQLVFCIDTRSEIIRRHLENAGPYETHGYAGFFGVPMRYQSYGSDLGVDACPPIVDARHHVSDRPDPACRDDTSTHDRWTDLVTATRKHFKSLKSNVVAAFPFVEGGGSAYGAALAGRTLFPGAVHRAKRVVDEHVPSPSEFSSPAIDATEDGHGHAADGGLPHGMTHEEKVEYAATAFKLMGWEEFGRLVVFTGHASETTNNPFDSSLDCGACAGNPGGPSARVLATICNDEDVQESLRERGHDIPTDTVYLAAEHNTTTDEVTLYDDAVPESHHEELARLRENLEDARAAAAAERAASMGAADGTNAGTGDDAGTPDDGVREVERRASDWAETRPEWGLAGNAAFVIGPRELTAGRDLDGRAFLHSYDPSTDPDGDALEAIMTGPLVVTQWINSQYYFATVDNATYGSGSKTTQNPVGNVGVVQGNAGDLMTGLPKQSLMAADDRLQHQPLRLTAVVHAPVERVTEILREHESVRRLFDNGWLHLTVVSPEQDGGTYHYQGGLEWESPVSATPTPEPAPAD
ncbi:DUF2309 domain-containing protein [Halorubrum gandharaense]